MFAGSCMWLAQAVWLSARILFVLGFAKKKPFTLALQLQIPNLRIYLHPLKDNQKCLRIEGSWSPRVGYASVFCPRQGLLIVQKKISCQVSVSFSPFSSFSSGSSKKESTPKPVLESTQLAKIPEDGKKERFSPEIFECNEFKRGYVCKIENLLLQARLGFT